MQSIRKAVINIRLYEKFLPPHQEQALAILRIAHLLVNNSFYTWSPDRIACTKRIEVAWMLLLIRFFNDH